MDVQATEVRERALLRPRGDIYQENDKVIVRMEMPGVAKSDLEVKVEGNELKILGKRSNRESGATYFVRERMEGDFAMDLTFDETIDRGGIDAVMENGILTLTLKRKEAEKPRKIEVKGE
jgi:HSP20 family protein